MDPALQLEETSIKDHLELFSGPSFNRLNKESFKSLLQEAEVQIKGTCKELGLSRTRLYSPGSDLIIDEQVRSRLIELISIYDLAYKIFREDRERSKIWLFKPNNRFLGFSPFQMAIAGKGGTVIDVLSESV